MTSLGSVLVIEDDGAIRDILRISLSDEGYDVVVSPNGEHALTYLRSWTPGLIILDMMMPIMAGTTFRERQQSLGLALDARLIVLSASRTARPQATALGADSIVEKPFELDELLDVVRQALAPGAATSNVR
jgi:DNA-binding response OmpR family regulator